MPEFTPEQLSRIEALALNARASGEQGIVWYRATWPEALIVAKNWQAMGQEVSIEHEVITKTIETERTHEDLPFKVLDIWTGYVGGEAFYYALGKDMFDRLKSTVGDGVVWYHARVTLDRV